MHMQGRGSQCSFPPSCNYLQKAKVTQRRQSSNNGKPRPEPVAELTRSEIESPETDNMTGTASAREREMTSATSDHAAAACAVLRCIFLGQTISKYII